MRPILEVRDEVGEVQLLKQLREGQRPADRRDSHDYGKFHEIDRRLWLDDLKAKEVMTYGTLPDWDSKIVPTVLLPFSGVVACPVFVGPVQAKHAGGPKLKYERESVTAYLKQRIREKGKPPSHKQLWQMAERWFEDRNRKAPGETWLKGLATEILKELSRAGR
jgi:hypothetical protein